MSKIDFDKIRKYHGIKDKGKIMSDMNTCVKNIANIVKNMSQDDIIIDILTKKNQSAILQVKVDYENTDILALNAQLKKLRKKLSDIDVDVYKYSGEIFVDISIDTRYFNKFDMISELYDFIKQLGLGKKIIKQLVKKFGYISFQEPDTSDEMKLLVRSLATKDPDVYAFSKNNHVILFDKEMEPAKIISVLNEYLKETDDVKVDKDFIKLHKSELKPSDILYKITNAG